MSGRAQREILVVAFHFPPLESGSGYLRTAKFCHYLPEFGWRARVITVDPRAHGLSLAADARRGPPGVETHFAFGRDLKRWLGVGGRYPGFLAAPDRWWSWCPAAIARGLRLARSRRPAAVLSTYPIASAHLVGLALHRLAGLPWIADFRDPMPPPATLGRVGRYVERETLARAARVVFTTAGARDTYRARFPGLDPERLKVVANGFDEADFDGVPAWSGGAGRPRTLVHSGLLYRDLRDPLPFFEALATLKRAGRVDASRLRVSLRASGFEAFYRARLEALDIADLVGLDPPVPYRDALREMAGADGLLLFQGRAANGQIPAKAYEYLRAGAPIVALTDPAGNTAALLRESGAGVVVDMGDAEAIATAVDAFLSCPPEGARVDVERYSRRHRAMELAAVLDDVA